MNREALRYFIMKFQKTSYKQESVSVDLGVNRSRISKYISGRSIDDGFAKMFLEHYNIEFQHLVTLSENLDQLLISIYEDMLYNNDDYLNIIQRSKALMDGKYSQHLMPYQLAMLLINHRQQNYRSVSKAITKINPYIECMNTIEKVIYLDLVACIHYENKQYASALETINRIEHLDDYDNIMGMIAYHKGIIHRVSGNRLDSIHYFTNAKTLFANALNFIRIIYTQMSIGNAFAEDCQYSKAIKIYQDIIDASKRIKIDDSIIALTYRNISLCQINSGNEAAAIENALKSLTLSYPNAKAYFYIAYAYMIQEKSLEALEYCRKVNKEINSEVIEYRLCQIISMYINKDPKTPSFILESLAYIEIDFNFDYIVLCHKILIRIYEQTNDTEKCLEYSLKLNDLYSTKTKLWVKQ